MTSIPIRRDQLLRLLHGHPVQITTAAGLLEFEAAEPEPWVPMRKVDWSRHLSEVHRRAGIDPTGMEVWTNGAYEAFVKPLHADDEEAVDVEGMIHLSIKRMDRMAIMSWRVLQQIKNEVVGEFREAVELYPGEHRVADNANQYHLFVAPEGVDFPFGFPSGFVIDADETAIFNANGSPAFQEPREPGITVGDRILESRKANPDPKMEAAVRRIVKDGSL